MLAATASIVDQWWNVLTRDLKVPRLSHSLMHVFALLPEVLRDNILKVKLLHEEVSLLSDCVVLGRWALRV